MTAMELYELLNKAGVDYDIIEIFEGSRFLRIEVEEEDTTAHYTTEGESK
jgi:hypothetical protein